MKIPNLFLTRDVNEPETIKRYKAILDEWSRRIPFSPIQKLGTATEFISALEIATFKSKVISQIERRWLEDREEPYSGQKLPTSSMPKTGIDPWKIIKKPFADFAKHLNSEEVFETRKISDCSTCSATGQVTCECCGGRREVDCGGCCGYGHNKCSNCSGSGHIQKYRVKTRQIECYGCGGRGKHLVTDLKGNPTECVKCHGRGSFIEEYDEEYFEPCSECAASGKVTCDTCHGSGKVTCDDCSGSGKVSCGRCLGERRLMTSTSVEIAEEPSTNESQYIPQLLPEFKKNDNPLTNLKGENVYIQDETKRIESFTFNGQAAAEVLTREVESCRAGHSGCVLRQRIEVECCLIVEYRYRHQNKEYKIYINPEYKFVEDLEGPIQAFIGSADGLAEKAFMEKRYEDAYRLVTRGLCMDEATEAERHLRDHTLKGLLTSYHSISFASWLLAATFWVLATGLPAHFQINWWFITGIIPLVFGTHFFAADFGVRMKGPRNRALLAFLIGFIAFLSGISIGTGTKATDWIGLSFLTLVVSALGLFRAKSRVLRRNIESQFAAFSSPRSLETYVLNLDPTPSFYRRTLIILSIFIALLLVQPAINLATNFNRWALDRTRLNFSLNIDQKAFELSGGTEITPGINFNQKPVKSGDKVQPGKGIVEVTAPYLMPYHKEVSVSYGRPVDLGQIVLVPAHGKIEIATEPQDATFNLKNQYHHWSGNLPYHADLPIGEYELVVERKGWEIATDVVISRGGDTVAKVEFPYGSLEVTSEPAGMTLTSGENELGKTPFILPQIRPGKYTVICTDGENDLQADITIEPKITAKHAFIFHYGIVQLSSIPAGAAVIRKGKEIGKTPLTINHIPAGETMVELRLQDYASTNLSIKTMEGVTNQLSAHLVSERYLHAISQAREAFGANQFDQAQKAIAAALVIQPDESVAIQLKDEIAQALAEVENAKAKAAEAARVEQANAKAREMASLALLDFDQIIFDCSDTRQVSNPVVMNDGYYDNSGKFVLTGQHTEMHYNTEASFNDARFAARYIGKTYRFDSTGWKIAKVEKDGTIVFRASGSRNSLQFGQNEIRAIPSTANKGKFLSLKIGQQITIKVRIKSHDRGDFFSRVLQRICLEDAEILDHNDNNLVSIRNTAEESTKVYTPTAPLSISTQPDFSGEWNGVLTSTGNEVGQLPYRLTINSDMKSGNYHSLVSGNDHPITITQDGQNLYIKNAAGTITLTMNVTIDGGTAQVRQTFDPGNGRVSTSEGVFKHR